MGTKLIVVCGLALFMTVPALFVAGLVEDRSERAAAVIKEISDHVGGQQTFLGPTLAVPYTIAPQSPVDLPKQGTYLIFPAHGSAVVKTVTEERRRSLFKVPVFQADLQFDASFDLTGAPAAAPQGSEVHWDRAEFVVGVSDPRGALADASLTAGGKTLTLAPAQIGENFAIGGRDQSQAIKLTLFGTTAAAIAKPGTKFNVTSSLRFSGAERIAVLAYGKTTHLSAKGDWPSPGFDGGYLPISRSLSRNGFTAEWSVPFIARGVRAEGVADSLAGLDATALGISFVEVADPYQSVSRSLKYAPLFLGLLFLSYFVFEATTGKRVHPAQYVLVGIAQIIFYLLLLSFAERTGFDIGFLIAGVSTVGLLSSNAGWVFASRLQGLRAVAVFASLYVMIYLLLRLEDNALMVGAMASFLAVAAAMYFTRGIDWYSSLPGPEQAGVKEAVKTAGPSATYL
ncbi:MAG TPA: cell envelope integrity protein CreD [Acidisarcina sp.]